jgi:hypothetical protein
MVKGGSNQALQATPGLAFLFFLAQLSGAPELRHSATGDGGFLINNYE